MRIPSAAKATPSPELQPLRAGSGSSSDDASFQSVLAGSGGTPSAGQDMVSQQGPRAVNAQTDAPAEESQDAQAAAETISGMQPGVGASKEALAHGLTVAMAAAGESPVKDVATPMDASHGASSKAATKTDKPQATAAASDGPLPVLAGEAKVSGVAIAIAVPFVANPATALGTGDGVSHAGAKAATDSVGVNADAAAAAHGDAARGRSADSQIVPRGTISPDEIVPRGTILADGKTPAGAFEGALGASQMVAEASGLVQAGALAAASSTKPVLKQGLDSSGLKAPSAIPNMGISATPEKDLTSGLSGGANDASLHHGLAAAPAVQAAAPGTQTVLAQGAVVTPQAGVAGAQTVPAHLLGQMGATVVSTTAGSGTNAPAASSASIHGAEATTTGAGSVHGDGSEMVPATGINTAQVLQKMSDTEMRVGMHSVEFGSISIRASLTPLQQMTASISLDHGDLSQALATHVANAQTKLGEEYGMHATIEINQQGSGFSGGSGHAGSQAGSQPGAQYQRTVSNASPVQGTVASAEAEGGLSLGAMVIASSGSRLDIRV